jgi:uncharacterized phage protein (TIGR01671 family)|tara:strand:+ start:835 stop:1296 length:462 start_codon:yes stop_codon:yes gene_type:complete
MSREIKFRVWHKPTKQFVKQDIFYLDEPSSIGQLSVGLDGTLSRLSGMDYEVSAHVSDPEDYAIQQYTGLKDKNGKDIYEGDILGYFDAIVNNDKRQTEIKWAKAYSGEQWCEFTIRDYNGKDVKSDEPSDYYGGVSNEYKEVIGNVFERVDK